MKVAGFSFIRNALKYDYPIVEAITSILPLCDEFIIAVGQSDDQTEELIKSIQSSKIKIIHTVWDDNLREGGRVLAQETDKALAAISSDVDWAFYIQGDEVLHEKYIPVVKESMHAYLNDASVEGLLVNYMHFYGSYKYIGNSRRWYRREIRIVRHTGNVMSYQDAQGFRRKDNTKLSVKLIDAYIYHYGWVKSLEKQRNKASYFSRFWHSDQKIIAIEQKAATFAYENNIDSLALFEGTHPAVMHPRVAHSESTFEFDVTRNYASLKTKTLALIEKITGWRIGEYKNYKLR